MVFKSKLKKCDRTGKVGCSVGYVEGTVERLLLSSIIQKDTPGLLNQYVSIIEVGGAYAHIFQDLIKFLNVKTLIITDIDSIDSSKNRSACPVDIASNVLTSNQTLINWLPKKETVKDLLACNGTEKLDGIIRIAYQIPEGEKDKCGRSFEEAFILKNAKILSENKLELSTKKLFQEQIASGGKKEMVNKTKEKIVSESYIIANDIPKKTDFAFDIMLLGNWETPKYISEGLKWLEQ